MYRLLEICVKKTQRVAKISGGSRISQGPQPHGCSPIIGNFIPKTEWKWKKLDWKKGVGRCPLHRPKSTTDNWEEGKLPILSLFLKHVFNIFKAHVDIIAWRLIHHKRVRRLQ